MAKSAAEKFKEDLEKRIVWWETEFELDHWSLVGVLMDVAVDIMFGYTGKIQEQRLEDEDDEDDEEEEDDED